MMVRMVLIISLFVAAEVAAECPPFDDTIAGFCERARFGGKCLESGDYPRAYRWFSSAAEGDQSGEALFYLGVMNTRGWATEKDETEATSLFGRSADRGFPGALYNYGMRLLEGTGVAQDQARAARFLYLAAEQGIAEASYVLGLNYVLGDGIDASPVQAYVWLSVAHRLGYQTEINQRYRTRTYSQLPSDVAVLADGFVEAILNKIDRLQTARNPFPSESC